MQVRALRLFVELARSDSIRQAAQRLDMVPTALARQIDSLEYFFRAELLDRGAAGIRLTEAGRLLAERASLIAGDIDATRALIDDLRGLQRGQVAIRAGGAVVGGLLAPVLAGLHGRHPGLRFSIEVTHAAAVAAGVADGAAALGATIFSPEGAAPMICGRWPIEHAVIVGPSHPLVRAGPVSLAALAAHPLALPDPGFGARQDLDRLARARSLRLDPVFVTGSLDMQKALASRGAAALVLPPLCCTAEIESGRLVAVPLAPDSRILTSLDLLRAPQRTLPFAAQAVLNGLEAALSTVPPPAP